jgi:hypothetical protein
MGKTTIVFGLALIVLGIVSYLASGAVSITAMIPAFFGVPLTALGAWANTGEKAKKTAMHIASVVGLIGTLAPLSRIAPALSRGGELGMAFWSNVGMFLICGVFLALCIRSFVRARALRNQTA